MSAGNQALGKALGGSEGWCIFCLEDKSQGAFHSFSEYILTSWNWSWQETVRRHLFMSSFIEQIILKHLLCLGGHRGYDREQN